jgi:hypothetical protein
MPKLTLNYGTIANDGTGDTLRTASQKIENNFDEIYTKFGDGSNLISNLELDSNQVSFLFSGGTKRTTLLADSATVAQRTVTIPDYTGYLVMDGATQTLTNKELQTPLLHEPRISDADSDFAYVLKAVGHVTKDINLNLPVMTDSDTFIFASKSATLTNKTLTSPTIYRPIIQGDIRDSSGNEMLSFLRNSSAVTYLQIENKPTASPVTEAVLRAIGATNTNLVLEGNNSGGVNISSRFILDTQELTSGGTDIDADAPLTYFNIGGAVTTHTLEDGVTNQVGEIKEIINVGAGTQTISTISGYTSIAMPSGSSVRLVWIESAWHVLNTYDSVTVTA